ncbi:cysteine hydrolase family protein [Candidatus Bipolaricaulota bacterium]
MNRSHIAWVLIGVLLLCSPSAFASQFCDTALLVIDMQTIYLSHAALANVDGLAILPKVAATIEAARSGGVPVIYAKNLDSRVSEDDESLGFPELIAPIKGDIVITKRDPDPFEETVLESILNARGITRLIICGIWSSCCVKDAVLAATRLGLEVIVVADAHGDSVLSIPEIATLNSTWDAMNGVSAVRLEEIAFGSFCR